MDGFFIALAIVLFAGIILYLRKAEQAERGDSSSGGRDGSGSGGGFDRDRGKEVTPE